MDMLHGMVKMLYDGNLHLAPLKEPKRILDVGAGSGIWAMEMASLYPDTEIHGTDLSPVQPTEVPENVYFLIDDATEPDWLWPLDHFDMIHTAHLAGSFPSFLNVLRTAYKYLKPGGYMECLEFDFKPRCDDGTMPPPNPDGPSAYAWHDWHEYHKQANSIIDPPRPMMIATKLSRWMREMGLVDVVEDVRKVPMNRWPKDPKMKQIGAWNAANWLAGCSGLTYGPFGPAGLGWSKNEIEVFLVDVRKAIQNRRVHSYLNMHAVTARKPFPGEVVTPQE
ncbi:hypothetical protein FQN54_007803 [Arachnomyces sp. PD_36]|nr:hypothetical protein FQN54_007803 [Arachnomyces sp. PD_36]